jgi:GNAT superfamily N-acetyltransferase
MECRLDSHETWRSQLGEKNHQAMRRFVESGEVPGILAYVDGEPAGWCSVSPRPSLIGPRPTRESGGFKDRSVWGVICFCVPEHHRGIGLMGRLLEAAVNYALRSGATMVEGYPFTPENADDGAGGTTKVFERAGFVAVRELLPGQFLMRYDAANA